MFYSYYIVKSENNFLILRDSIFSWLFKKMKELKTCNSQAEALSYLRNKKNVYIFFRSGDMVKVG